MFFVDTVGNVIQIVKRPMLGSHFDYLWTAQFVDNGPGKGMRFSFDSGDIGYLYFEISQSDYAAAA